MMPRVRVHPLFARARKTHTQHSINQSRNVLTFTVLNEIPVESLLSEIYIWFCIELCRYAGLGNSYEIKRNVETC